MPKLRAAFASRGKPGLWFCSLCGSNGTFFQTESTVDREQARDLDRQFAAHCRRYHPGGQVHGMGAALRAPAKTALGRKQGAR